MKIECHLAHRPLAPGIAAGAAGLGNTPSVNLSSRGPLGEGKMHAGWNFETEENEHQPQLAYGPLQRALSLEPLDVTTRTLVVSTRAELSSRSPGDGSPKSAVGPNRKGQPAASGSVSSSEAGSPAGTVRLADRSQQPPELDGEILDP